MSWFFQLRPEIKKYIDSFEDPSDMPFEAEYDFTFREYWYLVSRCKQAKHNRRKRLAEITRQNKDLRRRP